MAERIPTVRTPVLDKFKLVAVIEPAVKGVVPKSEELEPVDTGTPFIKIPPATFNEPPIPTPPPTTKAPVPELIDKVDDGMATPYVEIVPKLKLVAAIAPVEIIPLFVLILVTFIDPAVNELVPKFVFTLPLTVPTNAPFIKILPPTYKFPLKPAPPDTIKAPLVIETDAAFPTIIVFPSKNVEPFIIVFPPIFKLPPIPTPPATTNAPFETDVDDVVLLIYIFPAL